jgi:hypothetical protein
VCEAAKLDAKETKRALTEHLRETKGEVRPLRTPRPEAAELTVQPSVVASRSFFLRKDELANRKKTHWVLSRQKLFAEDTRRTEGGQRSCCLDGGSGGGRSWRPSG